MPPITDLLLFAAAFAGAGVIAGFLAGLFGIGGGAILVPVYYQVFGLFGVDDAVRTHLAIGTSIAVIAPTSLRAFAAQRRRGSIDGRLLKSWLTAVPLGAVLAAVIAAFSSSEVLRSLFAFVAILVGLRMLLTRESWKLGDDLPKNPLTWFVGMVIGLLSGLMGVGGGVLNNTFMTVYGRPVHQAVGTSSGVGVLIALPGLAAYVAAGWGASGLPIGSTGFVNWIAVALTIPVTLLVAPLGVSTAHLLSRRQLEIGCGIFLMLVAVRFLVSL